MGTLLCIGITVVTTTTPAAAVNAQVKLPLAAATIETSPARADQLQSLTVASLTAPPLVRDDFTIGEVPPPPARAGARA